MKTFLSAGLVAVGFVLATPAMATVYHCKLSEHGRSNFIPGEVLIDYKSASGDVRVIDPLIQHYQGGPIAGRVSVKNNRRITFAWALRGAKGNSSSGTSVTVPTIKYRLTIQNGSHAATISAVIAGADNRPSGSGSCTLRN